MSTNVQLKRLYLGTQNSPITDELAQRYGPALHALEEKLGRRFTPADVVQEARNPKSPLHDHFTWDVSEAAQKRWLQEARLMVNHVRVVVVDQKGKQSACRAFFSVNVTDENKEIRRAYVSVETISLNENFQQQVVARALHEAQSWSQRYSQYQELHRIRVAIQRTAKKLKK